MKRRTVVLLAALGIAAFIERDEIRAQWAEIFPDDPARATALERCAYEDRQFNGFSAEARTVCYQRWLVPDLAPGSAIAAVRAPNAIDLARAAGQSIGGQMPEGDIRNEQATDLYRRAQNYDNWAQAGPPFDPHRYEHMQQFSPAKAVQ
jgi:hypothetical protein